MGLPQVGSLYLGLLITWYWKVGIARSQGGDSEKVEVGRGGVRWLVLAVLLPKTGKGGREGDFERMS